MYSASPSSSWNAARKRSHEELQRRSRDLEQSHSLLRTLVEALQIKDERDALEIFRHLREGTAVDQVVRNIHEGNLIIQTHGGQRAGLRTDFPYLRHMPQALLTANNPYITSKLFETTFGLPTSMSTPQNESGDQPAVEITGDSPYVQSYDLAQIVDAQLDKVVPSRWTIVLADESFLRMLLKLYFQYEHQFYGFFKKDLFLEDMLSGSTTFCSDLLVNAVLALACVSLQERTCDAQPILFGKRSMTNHYHDLC